MKFSALIEAEGLTARLTPVGRFPWPTGAAQRDEVALVVGPAPCLLEDLARLPEAPDATFAVNRAYGLYAHRVDHLVTCHPIDLPFWRAMRNRLSERCCLLDGGAQIHSTANHAGVDFVWGFNPGFGSSGGMAVFITLLLGYSRVYLAGVPLENTGYVDAPDNPTGYHDFRPLWEANLSLMKGRVFSLSGPETFTGRLLPLEN